MSYLENETKKANTRQQSGKEAMDIENENDKTNYG